MTALNSAEWSVTALAPQVQVIASRQMPILAQDIEKNIQKHWDNALKQYPELYNGRVFCADHIQANLISGHWSEFRRVLAQMKEPHIFGADILRPLAVVGLMKTPDGVVIGQRSQKALYLPSFWQGVPAGNVESRAGETEIDLAAQLAAECEEELGLKSSECRIGACLLACEHPDSHIVDIGIEISVSIGFPELQKRCLNEGNAEYGALFLMQTGRTPDGNIVPTLRAMLDTVEYPS